MPGHQLPVNVASPGLGKVVIYGRQQPLRNMGIDESSPYLLQFEDGHFRPIDAPMTEHAHFGAYQRDASGGIWLRRSPEPYLWYRPVSGAWQSVTIPDGYDPWEVGLAHDGAVLIFGSRGGASADGGIRPVDVALLSNRAPSHVAVLEPAGP
jgi:hypothetical protein